MKTRTLAAPCSLLGWDTDFWGFPIARIDSQSLSEELVEDADAWCRLNGVRCLYFLAHSDDPETMHLAANRGFRLVDVRLALGITLDRREQAAPTSACRSGTSIRQSRESDMQALRAIAGASHRSSRFYADANFPRARCDLLYETWIEVSCRGYADTVLVAELGGKPVGYVSCHIERKGLQAEGRIGLFAVSGEAQGDGIGRSLLLSALAWFGAQTAGLVPVVT
ncbi:MAG: GNAT family N-acetyltransferase, partial [Dehalococcoidales bacterium]|nr:GNAT family N-acetyltransferase [Dehalococcoidales bacterium]